MEYATPGKVSIPCGLPKTVDSFPLTNRGSDITMGVSNYGETIALLRDTSHNRENTTIH